MSEQIQKDFLSLNRKRHWAIVFIVFAGLCASGLMYVVTAQGPGVSPDSTIYLEAARTLLAGNGLFVEGRPMTHYPPLFSLLLAGTALFIHGDTILAARLLASIFFGANLVLLALAVWRCTRHSLVAVSCVILLFLLSAPIISLYSMVGSEPPYIAFSMAGFILLAHHIERPSLSHLVLASLMFGAAASTRYIGLTLFPTLVLALFFLSGQSFKQKVKETFISLGVSCLPLVLWVIRNKLIADSMTNREFVFHPLNLTHILSLTFNVHDFVLPIYVRGWIKAIDFGIFAIIFVVAVSLFYRKVSINQGRPLASIVLPSILVIYSVVYMILLMVSISFFDAHTPIDHPILLPVLLALITACTSIARALSETFRRKSIWYAYLFLVVLSISTNITPAISKAVDLHDNGSGFTDRYWRDSASIAYLSRVPETLTIYSNGPDVIRFLTLKEARMIPAKVNAGTQVENGEYREQMSRMIRECEKGEALIIYFNRITWRWYLPSKEETESQFSIPLALKLEDGVLYGLSVVALYH